IWAAKEKIVNGMSETTFAPNESITREQIATILYRYDGAVKVSGDLDQFSDASDVSTYALDAMVWAVKGGIIGGMNGKLAPKDNATRAQIATILYRYLGQ
ncbi:MAG: S-layer homology domain-containing protein, partial [Faecousia sp.]